ATDFGYRVAQQFGLRIQPTRPALVPLTFTTQTLEELKELSGVSVDAMVSCNGSSFRENILFTHRGVSGPAILQASSYWRRGDELSINLLPDTQATELFFSQPSSDIHLATLLSQHLPRRFALTWCEMFAPSKPIKQYSQNELQQIAAMVNDWHIAPDG